MKSNHPASVGRIRRLVLPVLLAVASAGHYLPSLAGAEMPAVRVENIRRAFHNGEHNAFTDLVRWRGKFWLTFRSSPDGHGVFPSGSVVVLTSDDTKTWRQVHRFSVVERDTRDPHFLIFKGKLFVYSGAAYVGKERIRGTEWNAHYGYATWTADGTTWAKAKALEGTYGHYIWRAAAFGDKAYLCARRWRGHIPGADRTTMEAALLESDDGLTWRFRSFIQETEGNETALLFQPDGTLLTVSRTNNAYAILGRTRPPYVDWTRQNLSGYIGGPMLARWGDRFVVGGRRRADPEGKSVTSFMWLDGTNLIPFAELPSGGDNSYPGFVELDDGRGLVSWYSTHEKGPDGKPFTAVYLAELALVK
jgi:hypothetical protein